MLYRKKDKYIKDMLLGEKGFTVPWALRFGRGLNTATQVWSEQGGTAQMEVERVFGGYRVTTHNHGEVMVDHSGRYELGKLQVELRPAKPQKKANVVVKPLSVYNKPPYAYVVYCDEQLLPVLEEFGTASRYCSAESNAFYFKIDPRYDTDEVLEYIKNL